MQPYYYVAAPGFDSGQLSCPFSYLLDMCMFLVLGDFVQITAPLELPTHVALSFFTKCYENA